MNEGKSDNLHFALRTCKRRAKSSVSAYVGRGRVGGLNLGQSKSDCESPKVKAVAVVETSPFRSELGVIWAIDNGY